MSVRRAIPERDGIYFITFTCKDWLPLFELTRSYDTVYNWFDHLKAKGHYITGYVILPNHLHVLIGFKALYQSINTVVSNGKRFMAYEIVKRLEEQKHTHVLNKLSDAVTESDRQRGKLHQVFESSFDAKELRTKSSLSKSSHTCTATLVLASGILQQLQLNTLIVRQCFMVRVSKGLMK